MSHDTGVESCDPLLVVRSHDTGVESCKPPFVMRSHDTGVVSLCDMPSSKVVAAG